jgi:hypothetical protein
MRLHRENPMQDDRIPTWFESLLHDGASEEDRAEIEARFDESLQGERLLAAYRWLNAPVEAVEDSDLALRVMRRLPDFGGPETFVKLADLVLAAWARPELRAQLYRDARQGLAEAGIRLPEDTQIEIVPAESALLPRGKRIFLPLPPEDGPAIPEHRARRALAQSEFAWIWGPPWQEHAMQRASLPSSASVGLMPRIRRLLEAPAWRLSLAGLGVVAVLASGLTLAGQRGGVILQALSGSAIGPSDAPMLVGMAGLLLGFAALGFAIFGSRR